MTAATVVDHIEPRRPAPVLGPLELAIRFAGRITTPKTTLDKGWFGRSSSTRRREGGGGGALSLQADRKKTGEAVPYLRPRNSRIFFSLSEIANRTVAKIWVLPGL